MFLNKTRLKAMIKSAYKWEGLFVGRIYGGLVVAGGPWVTWTEDGYVPNWLKAAVMEHTGELPGPETAILAKKNEPVQYEVTDCPAYNLPQMRKECTQAWTVTPVVSRGQYSEIRFLQKTGHPDLIKAMAESFYGVIDFSELGEESRPSGPASVSENGFLVWKNEHSAYACLPLDGVGDGDRRIMDALKTVDFGKFVEVI